MKELELTQEERDLLKAKEDHQKKVRYAKAVGWMFFPPVALSIGLGEIWAGLSSGMATGLFLAAFGTSLGNAIMTAIIADFE